jgi:hypothetical protein
MSISLEQLCHCQYVSTKSDWLVSDIYLPQTHSWLLLPQQVDGTAILTMEDRSSWVVFETERKSSTSNLLIVGVREVDVC